MREKISSSQHFNMQSALIYKAKMVVENARKNSYMLLQARMAAEK